MKSLLLAVVCIFGMAAVIIPSLGYQNVGGDYGTSWLQNYGTMPASEFQVSGGLWDWGDAPKGYVLRNGMVYPPGTAPQWFYPLSVTDSTPIVINQSEQKDSQSMAYYGLDPWLLAQLSGRPVTVVNEPHGTLF